MYQRSYPGGSRLRPDGPTATPAENEQGHPGYVQLGTDEVGGETDEQQSADGQEDDAGVGFHNPFIT